MIYLCCALYNEAEPLIKALNLKKDTSINKFQVFKNEEFTLFITGCGKIKAAIAVTYMLSKINKNICNLLINIGICGTSNTSIPLGSCFLCNKITDYDTSFTYYPDIIFKHSFKENSLTTFSQVINYIKISNNSLVDLESSGIYEAASYFLHPHEIFFIKIVSDHLNTSYLDKKSISSLIKKNTFKIVEWTSFLSDNYNFDNSVLLPKDINLIKGISNNLKFSENMQNQLKHFFIYKKLQNKDINDKLAPYKHIDCNSKKEGKKYLEEIKAKLI